MMEKKCISIHVSNKNVQTNSRSRNLKKNVFVLFSKMWVKNSDDNNNNHVHLH